MAISATHYYVIRQLFEQGRLPQNGALFEVGEANWYNQLPPEGLADDIRSLVLLPARRNALLKRHAEVMQKRDDKFFLFHVCKLYYDLFFSPTELQAVDFNGSEIAQKLDLNEPLRLSRRFKVVINHGTAEHIFNIGQVFRTVHEYTLPGGMMIHESPFTGWIDHGFYALQPTLFFDLADVNKYTVVGMYVQDLTAKSMWQVTNRDDVVQLTRSNQLPASSMLLTVMSKGAEDAPFAVPIQGVYRQGLTEAGAAAWYGLR